MNWWEIVPKFGPKISFICYVNHRKSGEKNKEIKYLTIYRVFDTIGKRNMYVTKLTNN